MQIEEIKKIFSDSSLKVRYDELMSRHTYMHAGGPAKAYIEVETAEQLQDFLKLAKDNTLAYFIIGAGSNILVNDRGFDGIILKLRGSFNEVDFLKEGDRVIVKAGAAAMLSLMVKKSVDFECSGFEMLAGIPGTVGGALAGNSGTSEGTISDNLLKVRIVNTKGFPVEINKSELKFGYRNSSLEGQIIIHAEFVLKKSTKDALVKKITENLLRRSRTQPLGTFSAGSIFKNPEGNYAGKLIEECNLKGYRVGGAYVSDKHANFIINDGKATANDIQQVINDVRRKVKEKSGISLEQEIKVL